MGNKYIGGTNFFVIYANFVPIPRMCATLPKFTAQFRVWGDQTKL